MRTGVRKLTLKQEAFVRAYIETGNASEAYRRAYEAGSMSDEAVRVEACKLLKNPNVTLMVEQSHKRQQKRHEVTVDSVTKMLKTAYRKAKLDDKGAPAMVQAALGLGKLHGLIVDKKQVDSNNRHHHSAEPLSPFAEFLEGALGSGTKEPPEGSVPN